MDRSQIIKWHNWIFLHTSPLICLMTFFGCPQCHMVMKLYLLIFPFFWERSLRTELKISSLPWKHTIHLLTIMWNGRKQHNNYIKDLVLRLFCLRLNTIWSSSNGAVLKMNFRWWCYLLDAGLDQVLREEVSDQVEEGIQTVDLLVPWGWWSRRASPQFGVPRVDRQHQDNPEDGGNYSGGHVVHHSSTTHPATGFGV